MREITVINQATGQPISSRIAVAESSFSRFIGLMGKKSLDADRGLWIRPSAGVHTFWMRFPIDVVALDKRLRVVGLWPNLRPFRLSGVSFKTHSVLELPAGHIARCKIRIGDQMQEC
jgi:hypothetical protein